MKEQFKEWAATLMQLVDEETHPQEYSRVRVIADFLQSLSEMNEQEPDENMVIVPPKFGLKNGVQYVTKANRDWHYKQRLLVITEVMALTEQLAAKDARIAELERQVSPVRTFGDGVATFTSTSLDQPRPLLAGQPEVFDALNELFHSYCKLYATTHSINYVRDHHDPIYNKARKLLVGDV